MSLEVILYDGRGNSTTATNDNCYGGDNLAMDLARLCNNLLEDVGQTERMAVIP